MQKQHHPTFPITYFCLARMENGGRRTLETTIQHSGGGGMKLLDGTDGALPGLDQKKPWEGG